MDSATYDALGLSTPFEDKTGGLGRDPSGSGFLNINDDSELTPERAAVRNGPSVAEHALEQELYPLPPEATVQPGVPAGELTEHMRWAHSTVFPDTERDFWVYVPASSYSDTGTSCSLLVIQDGKSYLKLDGLVRTTTILDNMIASGALPPTVAIFLEPGRRLHPPAGDASVGPDGAGDIVDDAQRSMESDTVSERYGRFLVEDIVPFVQDTLASNITTDPHRRALMGVSSGAIAAFTAAWFHPNAFGGVISHCGSYVNIRGGDNLPWLVRNTPKKSLRVFLQSGENDLDNTHGCWPLANQTLARALAYAGYEHRFVFGKGWHSRIQGAHHLPATLTWMLGGEQAPPSL